MTRFSDDVSRPGGGPGAAGRRGEDVDPRGGGPVRLEYEGADRWHAENGRAVLVWVVRLAVVLAGVAGAFLAIPVAAVTSAVLDYMRQRRREQGSELLVTP